MLRYVTYMCFVINETYIAFETESRDENSMFNYCLIKIGDPSSKEPKCIKELSKKDTDDYNYTGFAMISIGNLHRICAIKWIYDNQEIWLECSKALDLVPSLNLSLLLKDNHTFVNAKD